MSSSPAERGPDPAATPKIWAIGGGKGGVGKSVVASNLAVCMARLGRRVVIVDGDLGGANLDTLFGCPRPARTLADFFARGVDRLADIAVPTGVEGLALVAGDADTLGSANPAHAQKQKLVRHLKTLPCDLVIVDLGAGTSFNTLDLYLAADVGIVVATAEPTSVQNAFAFIKTATLRALEQRTGVRRREHDDGSLRRIAGESADARAALVRATSLVVNRATPAEGRRVANLLHDLAGRFLGGQVCLRAAIREDATVARSIRAMRPVVVAEPTAPSSIDIGTLAQELWAPARSASVVRSGINETIEHEGIQLHVQSEDLGGSQGAVRTQIFFEDGSVLFTRRTPYVDAFFARLHVAPGDRVRFHHVAIVRALRSGRIDLLRRSA